MADGDNDNRPPGDRPPGEKKSRPPRRRRTNRPVVVERKGEHPPRPAEASAGATTPAPNFGRPGGAPSGPGQGPRGERSRFGGGEGGRRDRDRDRDRRGGRPGRPGGKGGFGDRDRKKAPPVIRTVEVTVEKGKDFSIRKRTDFDEKTRKPVSITYTLDRQGLSAPATYKRLSEAREAATQPLPEPPPPEAAAEEAPAEAEAVAGTEPVAESGPEEPAEPGAGDETTPASGAG